MADTEKEKERFFQILKKDAFFKEKVILSSGKESDYYLDARRVTLTPEGAFLSAQIILNIVKHLKIDAIGGPTLGADPLVGAIAFLSFQQGTPFNTFIIRKAPKAHGRQQQIEGPDLNHNAQVVLIDDVATTGKAFIQSLDVLEPMGIKVVQAICLIDRCEGAEQALAKRGCELVSVFTISDFLNSP